MSAYPVPALCSALLRRGPRRGQVCGALAVWELLALPSLPRYRCAGCAVAYPAELLRPWPARA